MLRAFVYVMLSGLLAGAASVQAQSVHPAFEVSDVHVSAKTTNPTTNGGILRGTRYELLRSTMLDIIRIAYGVEPEQVLGGPSWLEWDRYDVVAKVPPSTKPEELKLMLQALLAERFKLVVHSDSKPVPVFILSAGKSKSKLSAPDNGADKGCRFQPQSGEQGGLFQAISCHNMTMESFAQALPNFVGANFLPNPVIDSTGLKGAWNFDLKWVGRGELALAGSDGINIFDAVEKQLGLELKPGQMSKPVIVVDRVNEKATDNPPNLAEQLPPAPAEFEVADVKPSAPEIPGGGLRMLPGGRLEARGMSLKNLITLAWTINNDDFLTGGPPWIESERFDIVAKAAENTGAIDTDTLRLMLRALLISRFKLAIHTEEKPIDAFVLTAVKPKLSAADPANRTGCKEGPAPAAKDTRNANPVRARLVTCRNITMDQFANQLERLAPGYIRTSVFNATAMDGAWDFSFDFSQAVAVNAGAGRGNAAQPGGAPALSDPNGALSIFDSINKELGLKLEKQKRSLPVLVIDHIEQKPVE